jgi:hypothetical protein
MATYNRFTTAKPIEQKAVTTANRFTMSPAVAPAPVPAPAPTPVRPQIDSTRPITQKDTAFPQATWGDGKPVYANPAPVNPASYVKPEVEKAPYSFMEGIKPLDIKMPQAVTDFMNPLKADYQKRDEVIKAASERQREAMKPLEDLIRKPIDAYLGTAIKTGEYVAEKGEETALKILNHPVVADAMVELSKRSSGTGVYSMVKAIGPKTFDEAYQATRAYQAGDPSKLNQFFYQLGDTLPQTAIGVALNFAPLGTGVPLSTAYWTALSAAEQIQNKGQVTSLGNIAIDVIGDKMLGSSIEALFKAPAKTLIQTMVKNFSVEGGTEVAQDILKMANDYRNAKTPEERARIMAEAKEYITSGQILITGLVGGISGMAVGTAGYTINQKLPQTTVTSEEIGLTTEELKKNKQALEVLRAGNPGDQNIVNAIQKIDNQIVEQTLVEDAKGKSLAEFIDKVKSTKVDDNARRYFSEAVSAKNNIADISKLSVEEKGKLFTAQLTDIWNTANQPEVTSTPATTPIGETKTQGPGYQKFTGKLDEMVKNKTLLPEDGTILKTLFEGTNDAYLEQLNLSENPRLKSVLGRFSIRQQFGQPLPSTNALQMQKGVAEKGNDASRIFAHEFGHAGWYLILTQEERNLVTKVYKELGKSGSRALFTAGLEGNIYHHAKNEKEFFAESFAEYVMENKIPPAQLKPLYQRLASKFFEALKRLANRGQQPALLRLRPLFERALTGDKTTPLADLMAKEPPSFKQQLAEMLNAPQEPATKAVPPESIFPSGAIQDQKIEPQQEGLSPMEQIEIAAAPSVQQLPFDLQPEPLEKVLEGEKRTPLKERIRWIDYLRTPWRVFERMGIKANYLELLKGYTNYVLELPKNIDKITAWSKQVGPESNERIFRFLDGEKIELNPQEAKVAGEIKAWLSQWADRLGMKADERISSYITHIFPLGSKGEIPEEIAYLINKKIPGQVFDPFLLQREGAEGYIKDTWKALDAYVKRATRKVNMDPALASLKEASAQLTDTSQLNYLNRYIGAVNLRPTELDTSIDNHIKEKFGYMFGVRPTASLTRQARQMIARAKIGGSMTSFAKNLTQGVNTFSELGTRYTVRGYMDLAKFGGKELEASGVLIAPFLEDQTYSAIKKFAEKFDKVLFLNMNASELVNRGAAYYGAKAKYLNGDITPKEISKALGKEVNKDYTPTLEDAVAYGRFVAAKTQFLFGSLDTPVALNSDIAKTFAQFQTFGLKQAEFIGSMANEREWAKLFRYILSSMLLFTYIGGAFGMKWDDSFKTLRFGMPPVIQFIMDIWGRGIIGEDAYGNKLDAGERVRAVSKSLFTNVVPAGAQIMRGVEGYKAVSAGKSTTDKGNFQYKIAKTPMNYVRGTLFGKSNLSEAKAYYKSKDDKTKKSGAGRKRF